MIVKQKVIQGRVVKQRRKAKSLVARAGETKIKGGGEIAMDV